MRYQTVNVDGQKKAVYHIHGEIEAPNSLCLGFEHYSGTLEKMRSDFYEEHMTDRLRRTYTYFILRMY